MIFNVHSGFYDFSASKMPGKMVLYIFQQPSSCRIQKYQNFYSRIKIGGLMSKIVVYYDLMTRLHLISTVTVGSQQYFILNCLIDFLPNN